MGIPGIAPPSLAAYSFNGNRDYLYLILALNHKTGATVLLLEHDMKAIMLAERNANMALTIAHRGYVLQTGRVVLQDSAHGLLNHPMMKSSYLEL